MEKYNFVIENKRGEKYVAIHEDLEKLGIPECVLDSLEVYNIYIENGDDIFNIKCFLLSDIEKLESEYNDVEIWDDEFEDEDMEMSPEELEEDNNTIDKCKSLNEHTLKIINDKVWEEDDLILDDEFEDEDMEMSPEELEDNDDDVEIWDDEFEDEDMEMSPEELEDNDEYETKLEYLYRKYDCNDMETLQYRCPIDIKAYKQFTCLNSEATDEFKRLIDEREEKENEAIMKIVEERNKKERNIRYTSDDTETIFKSFFTI